MKISVIIPALNEEKGIEAVVGQIPVKKFQEAGHSLEIIVVDNGSTDRTAEIATAAGAKVISQPLRGYGNAYHAGFGSASGDIIVTGDADMTYPFDATPQLVEFLLDNDLDFLNTNRLHGSNKDVMASVNFFGNQFFSILSQILFRWPFRDSQSGMWIFKRSIWPALNVKSGGMPFSQELKIEAFMKGFKCGEIPIEFRSRVGKVKLNIIKDGFGNLFSLLRKRFENMNISAGFRNKKE